MFLSLIHDYYPIAAAKLREFHALAGKCSNITRWSSTAAMLKRFMDLKDFLPKSRNGGDRRPDADHV